MKKIYLLIVLTFMLPIVVNAEECTEEKLKAYEPYVNSPIYDVRQLGNSNTYEVWASNVTGGLALDHGRIVFDKGFLGYVTAGSDFIVRVYVADGSVCAGKTIKNVSVDIPEPIKEEYEEGTNVGDENNQLNPPVVTDKPSTNTEKENTSTNNTTQKPSVSDDKVNTGKENTTTNTTTNNIKPIQKPTVDNSTNIENNDSNNVDKPSVEEDDSETIVDEELNINDNKESNIIDVQNNQTKDNELKDDEENMKSALIFAGVSVLFIIPILLYSLKKKRRLS